MFRTFLAHHQRVEYLDKTTAEYIFLFHVEALLETHLCRICIADFCPLYVF